VAVRLPVLIAAVLGSGCGARTAAPPRVATPRPDAAQPAAPVDAPRDLATAAVAPFTEPAACRWSRAWPTSMGAARHDRPPG